MRQVKRCQVPNPKPGGGKWFNQLVIVCDWCAAQFAAKDIYAAKRLARQTGWRMDGQGKDMCPKCVANRMSDAMSWLDQAQQRHLFGEAK